jgi:NADPH:quinone reductase-like Zn-dependent oxidoreductase
MQTMKAERIHAYGASDVLVHEENVPRPEPSQDQVLVQVHASGVGPWDADIRRGDWRSMIDYPLPLILGTEVAGVVAEVGPGVTDLQIGQEVYGVVDMTLSGANAEYAVGHAAALAPKPKTLDFIQAAAVPVVTVTAWQMLFDIAQLQVGQTVLVHGAAGSVGNSAVQLAKRTGARVFGTSSAKDLDAVDLAGAEESIDYHSIPFEQIVHDVDVVIDTVGGDMRERSFNVLKPRGILVASSAPPTQADKDMAAAKGVRVAFVEAKVTADLLNKIAALIDGQHLTVEVGDVLPLEKVKQAHEMLESHKHARGKIVLRVLD